MADESHNPDAPKPKWTKGGPSPNPGGKRKRPFEQAQPVGENAEIAAPKQRGRPFKPGQSGNPAGRPPGARNHATRLAEALLDGQAEELVQKAISMALAGDPTAMRLALERICPPRRERAVEVRLPRITAVADLVAAAAALTDAAAQGEITPGEAASLSTLIGNAAKAAETFEFSERLARIEQQMASKGNQ